MLRQHVLRFAKNCVKVNSTSHAHFATANTRCSTFDDTMENNEWQNESTPQNEKPQQTGLSEKCVNKVTLLGRVGNNPELRGTESNPVVTFSLATSINYRPGGMHSGNELVKKTEWHNIAVFMPNLREIAYNYVAKGNRIMVQGRIMYGSIEDKQGMIRHTTSIAADDIIRFAPSSDRDN